MRIVIEKAKNGFIVDPGWGESEKRIFESPGQVAEFLIKIFGKSDADK